MIRSPARCLSRHSRRLGGRALALLAPLALATATAAHPAARQQDQELKKSFADEGIELDLEHGLVVIPVDVVVKDDLLEYLLTGPAGSTHETLFATPVRPSLLNAALLSLGVEPGHNARWEKVDGSESEPQAPPSEDDGAAPPQAGGGPAQPADQPPPPNMRLVLPEGDGFLLYVAWRVGDEAYFFRVEDLLADLATGSSMRRQRWVFLGSRFQRLRKDGPEVFVADLEQNLINISFFYQGNTLLTAALPECQSQTIWVANPWLVPPRDSRVSFVFAKDHIDKLPERIAAALPVVEPPAPPTDSDAR